MASFDWGLNGLLVAGPDGVAFKGFNAFTRVGVCLDCVTIGRKCAGWWNRQTVGQEECALYRNVIFLSNF